MVVNMQTGAGQVTGRAIPPPITATAKEAVTEQVPTLLRLTSDLEQSNSNLEECIVAFDDLSSRLNGTAPEERSSDPKPPSPLGAIPAFERELETLTILVGRLAGACGELKKLA